MNALDEYLSKNKDFKMKVTKVQVREGKPDTHVKKGDVSYGQVTLREFDTGSFYLAVNGGWTLRTSLIVGFKQESENVWLVKTANSVYRIEKSEQDKEIA